MLVEQKSLAKPHEERLDETYKLSIGLGHHSTSSQITPTGDNWGYIQHHSTHLQTKFVLSFALVLHGSLPCNALSAGNLRNEPDGQTPWENCGLVTIFADAPVLEWSWWAGRSQDCSSLQFAITALYWSDHWSGGCPSRRNVLFFLFLPGI